MPLNDPGLQASSDDHLSGNVLNAESAIFISDLHLSDQTPALIARFEYFCKQLIPKDTRCLVVMGDLFEGYCGDDDRSPCIDAVERAFIALHQRGIHVALMHGNRDFMIGQGFAQRCHALLLSDPCVFNDSILLSHGDVWCTLDTGYQVFRTASRKPDWQAAFLSHPLAVRQAQIQAYRAQSKAAQMDISSSSTDVVDEQVLASAMRYQCTTVLHGHTHRPSDRALQATNKALDDWMEPQVGNNKVQNTVRSTVRKVVLGDWDERHFTPVACARYAHGQLSTFLA